MPKTKKYNKKTNKKKINKRTIKKGGAETTKWLKFKSDIINTPDDNSPIHYSIDYNSIADTNKQRPFEQFQHNNNHFINFNVNKLIFDRDKKNKLTELNNNIVGKSVYVKFLYTNNSFKRESDIQYELSKNGECEDYVCKLYDYGDVQSMRNTVSRVKPKTLTEKLGFGKKQNSIKDFDKYIIIENCGYDLLKYMEYFFKRRFENNFFYEYINNGSKSVNMFLQQLYIVKDLLLGLQCIHKERTETNSYYIHGDIKLENITIKKDLIENTLSLEKLPFLNKHFEKIIKYIDFGHSEKVFNHDDKYEPTRKLLGTHMYYPPEDYFKKGREKIGNHSKATDIWALGLTILLLLFNNDLQCTKGKIAEKSSEKTNKFLYEIEEKFNDYYLSNFIKEIKKDNQYIINDNIITSINEDLFYTFYNLLHYDPTKRNLDQAILEFNDLLNIIEYMYHAIPDVPIQNFATNPLQQFTLFK